MTDIHYQQGDSIERLNVENQRKVPCAGRKASRTRTVPALKSNNLKGINDQGRIQSINKLHTSGYNLNSSHLELVANKCKALSAGQSCNLPTDKNPIANTLTEARTIYGLRQTLKDILESKYHKDLNLVDSNRHRQELTRVWSRERVTVTETRIYSRPPTQSNSRSQSGYGSSLADVRGEGSNLPKRIAIAVSKDDVSNKKDLTTEPRTEAKMCLEVEEKSIPVRILTLEGSSTVTSGPAPIIKRPKAINYIQSLSKIPNPLDGPKQANVGPYPPTEHEGEGPRCFSENYEFYSNIVSDLPPMIPVRAQIDHQPELIRHDSASQKRVYFNQALPQDEKDRISEQPPFLDKYSSENYFRSDIDSDFYQQRMDMKKLNPIDETVQYDSFMPHDLSSSSLNQIPINLEDKLNYTMDTSSQMMSSMTEQNSSSSSVYTTAKSSPFPTNPPTPIEHLGQFYPADNLIPERLKCSLNDYKNSTFDVFQNFQPSSRYLSNNDSLENDRLIQQSVNFRTIVRKDQTGYGFTVCGSQPVVVRTVRPNGTAERAGIRPGDEIVKVNGISVESLDHAEVVSKIKAKSNVCFMLRRNRLIHESELSQLQMGNLRKPSQNTDSMSSLSNIPSLSEEELSFKRQRNQNRRKLARETRMRNIKLKDGKYVDTHTSAAGLESTNPYTDENLTNSSIAEDDMTLADYEDDDNSTNCDISDIENDEDNYTSRVS